MYLTKLPGKNETELPFTSDASRIEAVKLTFGIKEA